MDRRDAQTLAAIAQSHKPPRDREPGTCICGARIRRGEPCGDHSQVMMFEFNANDELTSVHRGGKQIWPASDGGEDACSV